MEGNTSPYPRKLIFNNTISNVNMNGTGNFYGLYATDMGDGEQDQVHPFIIMF